MPRPGTRPYECIRRAWHSDSHQPLRGALIHEIFRLVNELHSTSTRRKKEWQEKLPMVVIRAEEILYSKANSEDEYAAVETLRSRLDDAVDTMIRREDSEEDGVYLVPCVEAALSLGCTQKTTPRGQRRGSSRPLSNVARRLAPAVRPAGIENGTIHMDLLRSPQEQHSTATFGLMTQALPLQDHDHRSTLHASHSSFGPIGAFWGPSPCCPRNTSSSILSQSSSFLKALDAHHPPFDPKQGALVQFLRATNASSLSGVPPLDAAFYGSPDKPFNILQEVRPLEILDPGESSEARMGSRLLHGDASACSPHYSSLHTMLRAPWDVCGDDHQYTITAWLNKCRTSLLTENASSSEKAVSFQLKECSLPPASGSAGSKPKAGFSLSPTWCKSDKALSADRNASATLSAVDDSSVSLPGDHDLQLRLGPPISEPSATSADGSARKRMRIDVLDPSSIHIL